MLIIMFIFIKFVKKNKFANNITIVNMSRILWTCAGVLEKGKRKFLYLRRIDRLGT